jgi:hypothetical protein
MVTLAIVGSSPTIWVIRHWEIDAVGLSQSGTQLILEYSGEQNQIELAW